jgi:chemotaxis protein MotB
MISLSEKLIFKEGQADLPAEALPVLDTIATMLRPIDNKIRLIGHTNASPSTNPAYPTNWELSLARAMSVSRYLMNAGIAPERFIVSGQGEYAPVFPNDTEEHRALNARVDIIIVYQVESSIIGGDAPLSTP